MAEKTLEQLQAQPPGSEDCTCPTNGADTGVSGPTKKPTYIVPAIGTVGTFEFKSPFDDKLYNGLEYEVKAIRSLVELNDSNEDPFVNIYQPVELSEKDFKTDLDHNVPIVVLSNSGGNYYYVPASKIKSMPKTVGVKYQQVMMAINLGYLPLDFDLELAKDTIVNDIKATLGITSTVESIKTSAVQLITSDEHEQYKKLLESNKTITSSYRIRYEILAEKNKKLMSTIKMLNDCIFQHLQQGKQLHKCPTLQPPKPDLGEDE